MPTTLGDESPLNIDLNPFRLFEHFAAADGFRSGFDLASAGAYALASALRPWIVFVINAVVLPDNCPYQAVEQSFDGAENRRETRIQDSWIGTQWISNPLRIVFSERATGRVITDDEADDVIHTYEVWDALNGLSLAPVMQQVVTVSAQIAPDIKTLDLIRQHAPLTFDPGRRS